MNSEASPHDADSNESERQADGPLVNACKLGDRDAQRRLYEQYGAKVFRLMVRMVGQQDAIDLTQQVFLQVYRKIYQFSGKSKLGTWLYRVAVNEALQFRRRSQSRPSQPLLFEPVGNTGNTGNTGNSGAAENQEVLEHALARIDPDLRAIFLLREVDELSYAQLAEVLGIPPGTVASRLNRARRLLRDELVRIQDS